MRIGVPDVRRPDSIPLSKKTTIDTVSKKTITQFVSDTSNKAGSRVVLKDLIFIGGRHFLVPESVPAIQELLTVMNKYPTLVISIEGHVCCIPGTNDGIDLDLNTSNLSEMRAKTVYDYLLRNGIATNRLSYKGFGHQFPVKPYPEKTVEDMNSNRRVEIKIVSR
jgi:outer membrane protein OmpA-like peptidoglycan-associated protein